MFDDLFAGSSSKLHTFTDSRSELHKLILNSYVSYQNNFAPPFDSYLDILREQSLLKSGVRVLDVGAGATPALAYHLCLDPSVNEMEVVHIDYSANHLELHGDVLDHILNREFSLYDLFRPKTSEWLLGNFYDDSVLPMVEGSLVLFHECWPAHLYQGKMGVRPVPVTDRPNLLAAVIPGILEYNPIAVAYIDDWSSVARVQDVVDRQKHGYFTRAGIRTESFNPVKKDMIVFW